MKLPKFREIIGADAYTASYTDAQGNAVSKTWKWETGIRTERQRRRKA